MQQILNWPLPNTFVNLKILHLNFQVKLNITSLTPEFMWKSIIYKLLTMLSMNE